MLESGDKQQKANTIQALGDIKDSRAVKPLIKQFDTEICSKGMRYYIIRALSKIGNDEAIEAIVNVAVCTKLWLPALSRAKKSI